MSEGVSGERTTHLLSQARRACERATSSSECTVILDELIQAAEVDVVKLEQC